MHAQDYEAVMNDVLEGILTLQHVMGQAQDAFAEVNERMQECRLHIHIAHADRVIAVTTALVGGRRYASIMLCCHCSVHL